jgi:hypothetical protein
MQPKEKLSSEHSTSDAALAGDVIVGGVVVRFLAVRALEGAGVFAANDRVRALAGNQLAPLDGKSLQAGFALDQPDKGHGSPFRGMGGISAFQMRLFLKLV